MDIFSKIFQQVVSIFHFQTSYDLHIASNMHMKIQCYVKILLFDIHTHTIIQYYFQKISLLHHEKKNFRCSKILKKKSFAIIYTG
jgi:hypothetical protein